MSKYNYLFEIVIYIKIDQAQNYDYPAKQHLIF